MLICLCQDDLNEGYGSRSKVANCFLAKSMIYIDNLKQLTKVDFNQLLSTTLRFFLVHKLNFYAFGCIKGNSLVKFAFICVCIAVFAI